VPTNFVNLGLLFELDLSNNRFSVVIYVRQSQRQWQFIDGNPRLNFSNPRLRNAYIGLQAWKLATGWVQMFAIMKEFSVPRLWTIQISMWWRH